MAGSDTGDRLNSWKEIAAWFDVSVRTVQRWEKEEGLPVHRHRHARLSSVFTSKPELEQWWAGRPDLQPLHASQPPRPPEVPKAARSSLAVLPFLDLSGDQETEVLGDGLTEELITALSQVEGLRVVARTSSFSFKGKTPDIRTVGKRLGVGAVLEGSIRRSGDRLRISAQLVNAGDGCHLWAQQFDRTMQDLLDIQEETCRAIVDALRLKLAGRQEDGIISRYGRDIEAYKLYLKGRFFFAKRLPQALLRAMECFEQALARDPGMALAYAGLADCHTRRGLFALVPPDEAFPRAQEAAVKALGIDIGLAEAHVSLAFATATYDYDWSKAEEEFRRALDLNPDHASAHTLYSAILLCQGRMDEGEIELALAQRSDPLQDHQTGAGFFLICRRQYDRAIQTLAGVRRLDPTSPYSDYWLAEAYLLTGMYAEAIAACERVESQAFGAGLKGYCFAKTDRSIEALHLLEEMKTREPYPALQIAIVRLGLGETDDAFHWLGRAVELRSLGIHWIKVDPIWDPIRPHPSFLMLLKKMNLAD